MKQTKEQIFKELREIHKDTFELKLINKKIVLTKRLKPQSKNGIVCLPEDIDVLGESSLANQTDIIKILFPEHKIEIEPLACINCTSLESIRFLNASKIGDFAFAYCKSLIELEGAAEVLGIGAFLNDVNLEKITFKYKLADDTSFPNCLISNKKF